MTVQAEFSNVEDGMLASTDPVWLKTTPDTLTRLFDRVGLRTKVLTLWVFFSRHSGRLGPGPARPTNIG